MTETEAIKALDRIKEAFVPLFDKPDKFLEDIDKVAKDLKELMIYKLAYEWKFNGVEGTYEELLDKARNTVEGWYKIDEQGYGEVCN